MLQLYKNIRERRLALGISQEELARKLGYTNRSSITKIESGQVDISYSKIEAFAAALQTTPESLMGWEEPPLPEGAIPIDFQKLQRIPILGRVSAGMPLYAAENIEGYTYTDLNHGGEYFALRVKGDSMNAARIADGDIVIVRKQPQVLNGEIAIVMVDGNDATVKRFSCIENMVTLMPQSYNPAHQPQVYDLTKTRIEVLGLVVKVEFQPV